MYTNILVALSSIQIALSDHNIFEPNQTERESFRVSREVLDEAIALAKPFKANLTLLHVLTEKEIQDGIRKFGSKEKFEQECQRRLKLLEDEVRGAGVEVDFDQIFPKLVSGKPGEIICNHARLWKNDLIVVGRRERHFHLLGPGGVSGYVIYHAPCTTFVVNSKASSISPEGANSVVVH
ncbi:MAG: universal stress protein [Leptolyngbyaceae cyanobacterium SL_7_1]|nr:universal stress protein [Leptolyngbyaceae cyanobacterium SL_7_1]